jgi:putative (di)nucleoside polyphosphate hydrolase
MPDMQTDPSTLPYRPCVGIMVLNREGQVWIGRRLPKWSDDRSAFIWQMPQGGIDPGEDPREAALRELEEETSIRSVAVVGESRDWLSYDLPDHLVGVALKGRYRGQRQKWFVVRFTGAEDEIDIKPRPGHKAEFDAWRWAAMPDLPGLIVPFKRSIYVALLDEFGHLGKAES